MIISLKRDLTSNTEQDLSAVRFRDIEDILADKIILKEINPGDTVKKISVDSKRKRTYI